MCEAQHCATSLTGMLAFLLSSLCSHLLLSLSPFLCQLSSRRASLLSFSEHSSRQWRCGNRIYRPEEQSSVIALRRVGACWTGAAALTKLLCVTSRCLTWTSHQISWEQSTDCRLYTYRDPLNVTFDKVHVQLCWINYAAVGSRTLYVQSHTYKGHDL